MKNSTLIKSSRNPETSFWAASCIDRACRPLVINQTWIYDRFPDSPVVKEALQKVLEACPTLAGRMTEDGIMCDNAGVLWEESVCRGVKAKDILRNVLPGKKFLADYDRKAALAGNFPLMSVKVSRLEDGTVLNVRCSHFCADGSSFYTMMENWASLARNEGFVRKPVYDDNAVRDTLAASDTYGMLLSADMESRDRLMEKEGMFRIRPSVMFRMAWQKLLRIDRRLSSPVFVPYSEIDSVKDEASGTFGKHAGRNAALSAIIAGILKQRVGWTGKDISIVHTADHRGRMRNICADYTGNASFTLRPTTVKADLPAGLMAALIDEDMKRMLAPEQEERYFATYCAMLESKMPFLPFDINSLWCAHPVTFIVNNCLKFNIYGVDFGEGSPIFAWPLDFGDPVRFWPAPPGQDGVYVYFAGNFA